MTVRDGGACVQCAQLPDPTANTSDSDPFRRPGPFRVEPRQHSAGQLPAGGPAEPPSSAAATPTAPGPACVATPRPDRGEFTAWVSDSDDNHDPPLTTCILHTPHFLVLHRIVLILLLSIFTADFSSAHPTFLDHFESSDVKKAKTFIKQKTIALTFWILNIPRINISLYHLPIRTWQLEAV